MVEPIFLPDGAQKLSIMEFLLTTGASLGSCSLQRDGNRWKTHQWAGGEMELLLRVQKLLREKDVTATINDGELFFQARFGPVSGRIRVSASQSAFTVCAHLGLFAPSHRIAAMYEGISRANWQLMFLRFQCDSSDGELRLVGDMPRYGTDPSDEQVTQLCFRTWAVAVQYAPALVQIMTSDCSPASEIAKV
jgi:hypothetical protein